MRHGPEAMDVESTNFKSYQQVSKWWSLLMTAGVIGAFVVAIIALAVGSAALNKVNNDDEDTPAPATPSATPTTTRAATGGVSNEADVPEQESPAQNSTPFTFLNAPSDPNRALPGQANYAGFLHIPGPIPRRHFYVITHGHSSPDYFDRLEKGLDDAAQTLGVDVSYFNPETQGDHDEIIEYMVEARRTLKNGMAVAFLEHTNELGEALRETAYDMPVMSMLLDEGVYDGIDIDTFANIGFSFTLAGATAALNFEDAGVERALCIRSSDNSDSHLNACSAFDEQFGEDVDIPTFVVETPDLANETIGNQLEDDVRGIFTVSKEAFVIARDYLESIDRLCSSESDIDNSDCIMLATIEADDEILQAVRDNQVAIALDRQNYAQGFLAVLFLTLRSRYHLVPGGNNLVLTGPAVIDNTEEAGRLLGRDIMEGKTIDDKTAADLDIRFIVHGKTSDPFWTQVKGGLRAAVRQTRVKIDFRHPDVDVEAPGDIIRSLVRMLREAQSDEVDVIVMSLPSNDPDLTEAVNEVGVDIPIYTINAGHRWFQDLNIRTHIGLIEGITGDRVAEKLEELNVNKILCVIADVANEDLQHRCNSIENSDVGIEVVVVSSTVDGDEFHTDMDDRQTVIRDAVIAALDEDDNSDVRGVISTGLIATEAVREVLAVGDRFCRGNQRPNNRPNTCIEFGAYDLDDIVFSYILADELNFAVDQQPELQGYLPIYFALMDVLYGVRPVGIVSSGPRFVDRTNVINAETIFGFLSTS